MTRPALELKIYSRAGKCPPPSDYDIDFAYDDWHAERYIEHTMIRSKQLADAELAAETYRQMVRAAGESGLVTDGENVYPGDVAVFGPMREETHRLGVLKRFAVLDHASVKDYA